jgi:hypothetical protein
MISANDMEWKIFSFILKKSDPTTRREGAWGERRHSSCSFVTSALDRGEWSASRPGRALPVIIVEIL